MILRGLTWVLFRQVSTSIWFDTSNQIQRVLSLTTWSYQLTKFGSALQCASTVVLYECKCSRFFCRSLSSSCRSHDRLLCKCRQKFPRSYAQSKNSFVQFFSVITCLTRVLWRSKMKPVARKLFTYFYEKFYSVWNSNVCKFSSEFMTTMLVMLIICVVQKSAQRQPTSQAIGRQ